MSAGRFAAVLLATTCLSPLVLAVGAASAWADGGTGGNIAGSGAGAGGADSTTGTGATGGNSGEIRAGGGGGGAGTANGGAGGAVIGAFGGAGGTAGVGAGGSGGTGGNGGNSAGGGGGGGGVAGLFSAGSTTTTTGLTGGSGGAGGTGNATGVGASGGGGGGGGAGYGAIVSSGTYSITAAGSAAGGAGGAGGVANAGGASPALATAGNGGSGGIGVFLGSGTTLDNAGTVTGGTGGAGGTVINGTGTAGAGGAGGVGVTGSGLTVINSGTISGGVNGLGSPAPQPDAIRFTGGTNVLVLHAGSTINGNVSAFSAADTLRLGGTTNSSFDVSQIGSGNQYRDFGVFEKTGTSIWTLTSTTTATTDWRVSAGTLQISANGNLGGAGSALVLEGGTLRTTADISSARVMLLGSGTNTVNTDSGTTLTWSGAIDGTGSLRKSGTGTLILDSAKTYSGGTTVSDGTLQLGLAGGDAGSITGAVTVAGPGTLDVVNANMAAVTSITNAGTVNFNNSSTAGSATITNNTIGIVSFNDSSSAGSATITNNAFLFFNANSSGGSATITNNGSMTFADSTSAGSAAIVTSAGGFLLSFTDNSTAGTATITTQSGSLTQIVSGGSGGQARFIVSAGGTFDISGLAGSGTTAGSIEGAGTFSLGGKDLAVGSNNLSTTVSGIIQDGGNSGGTGASLTKTGTGTLTLSGANTYTGGTTVTGGLINFAAANNLGTGMVTLDGGGLQWATGNTIDISPQLAALGAGGGTFDTNGNNVMLLAGGIGGAGGLTKAGAGTLTLGGTNTYGGGTTVTGGVLQGTTSSLQGNIVNNANVTFNQVGSGTYAGAMSGTGSLTKASTGTVILTGTNSYSGGTTVSGGILQGTTSSLQGNILNNANVTFNQAGTGTYSGIMSGTGGLLINGTGTVILTGNNIYSGGTTVSGGILQGNTTSLQGSILNNANVTFNQTGSGIYAGAMSGTGSMTLQGGGLLNLTGTSTYTGATTVNASTLLVNGSIVSTVSLNNGGLLGGTGSIGGLVSNGGTLAPGNSIGTLTINGNFSQNGGTYVVEANAAGQSDRVNVSGSATINGASVQLVAAPGSYANSTTYTILNATGGVSGTYTGVSSNFAFLMPSLTYNANNVFLTLALQGNAFSGFSGNTLNQRAVGYALDQSFANATGDFATVIGALAGLSTAQAPAALNTISGQPYADFGTTNVNTSAMFMNTLGQQMALARGGGGTGQRQALAEACEIEACDTARPLSAWFSGLAGLGAVQGNSNAGTLTYNFGGAAMGIDYRFDPRFLVGLGVGYTTGTQWVNAFMGKGWSDSVSVAAYGSFTQGAFYADALAGYAYFGNQLQRQIQIPGLARTANGSTGANQFLTQVETGYKLAVFAPAALTLTPFGRLQFSTTTQNAFTESGAQSLNLSVAQQTTNSVRTVLGAELGSTIGLGSQRTLDLALRLGWQHEYASTSRPITAAFSGAPSASFTVYGATPARDSAIIGFSASTTIAEATQLYMRYDGALASGTDNHALTAGLRLSW